jgi:tetratricopeptide (TPR) repeat protein
MHNLAVAYQRAGQLAEALPLYRETLARRKEKLGPDHPDTLNTVKSLAAAYQRAGQLDRSLPLREEVLSRTRKRLGPNHSETLMAQASLAGIYRDSGRLDKALPLLEDALQHADSSSQLLAPQLASLRAALADTCTQAGQPARAEKLYRQLLMQAQQQDKSSPQTAALLAVLGFNLLQQKKYTDAEPVLRECLAIRQKQQPGAWTTFNTRSLLGGALLGQKKYCQAEPLLTSGYQGMKEQHDKIPLQSKVRLREALERLVQLYEATGNKAESARWQKALEPGAGQRPHSPSARPAADG